MKKIILSLLFTAQVWGLTCSAPVTVAETASIGNSTVILNEKGDAAVIWLEKDRQYAGYKSVVRDGEKGWSAPELITWVDGHTPKASVFMNEEGTLFVGAKIEKNPTRKTFFQVVKKEKNKPWSDVVDVLGPEDNFSSPDACVFDPKGNAIFAGLQEEDPFKISSASRPWMFQYCHPSGQKISTALPLFEKAFYSMFETLVMNKRGTCFAVTTGFEGAYHVIKGLWIEEGKPKGPSFSICKLRRGSLYTRFRGAVNAQKNGALIWEKRSGPLALIEATVSANGKWEEAVELYGSSELLSSYCRPVIKIDDQENAMAVWAAWQQKSCVVFAAYKPAGGPWGLPKVLSNPAKISYRFSLKSVEGKFVVIWDEVDGKDDSSVHGAVLDTSLYEWTSAVLSPLEQKAWLPAFDLNKKGLGFISWTAEIEGRPQIQIAELTVAEK
jgi:hypothetical protein